MRLAQRLGPLGLAVVISGDGAESLVQAIATRGPSRLIQILIWNGTLDQTKQDGDPRLTRRIRLRVDGLPAARYRREHLRVDREHSNIGQTGACLGSPGWPDAARRVRLAAGDRRGKARASVNGRVLFKGKGPEGDGFGCPCTIVAATNEDPVARGEVCGPVAAVIPFMDEEDAVRIANDTPYGLSGSIWTRDGARALRVARALETGVLSINSNSSVRVTTPFGGFKQSGFGRELGMHAMAGYSEVKNVYISTEA